MLITHMQDLQEVTQEVHYENYRSERLAKSVRKNTNPIIKDENGTTGEVLSEKDRILREKEEEIRRMQEKLAQMQAKIQAQK